MKPKRRSKNMPGARCHKCKQDMLCEKHHKGGVYQVVCPSCGYESTAPYWKEASDGSPKAT